MKTWYAKAGDVEQKWWVVDATDQTLGRMATQIANVLRGKNKPQFTPHCDTGDFVVVINSDKLKLTGEKMQTKAYYTHSRFFGSLKETLADKMIDKDSGFMIQHAVKGMLPKNRLSRKILKKLKVYGGPEHPHAAQNPQALPLTKRPQA